MRFARTLVSRRLFIAFAALSLLGALATRLPPTHRRDARDNNERADAQQQQPDAHAASRTAPLTQARARAVYGQLELSFESNRGQAAAGADFVARGAGYAIFLKPTEAVIVLARRGGSATQDLPVQSSSKSVDASPRGGGDDAPGAARPEPAKVLRMKLDGAEETAAVAGAEELEGKVNYLLGNDPAKWRTEVPTYGRVRYGGVYPGVDLVYYGNQRQLEYDFVVAPGADARAVRLRFDGADKVEVDEAGALLLTLGETTVTQPKPVIYQEVAGARREVEGGYEVAPDGRVTFALGEYDASLPLVIDPVLVYSTYLGGSASDAGNDIAVDSAGNAYICGETDSANFPTANALDATFGSGQLGGQRDAFVTKLNAAGTALVYSTYLGGSGDPVITNINGDDRCFSVRVDASGNAYLAGETHSNDFPTANAFQATYGGGLSDAFVTKLNAAGSGFVYSTFLGGSIFDAAGGIAIDSSGNAYVTGRTTSANFPTANALQATQASADADAYVTKLNAAGSALVYSTYLGGSAGTEGGFENGSSIEVDSAGNAYVTGQTRSTNFPTLNPVQATFGGGFPDGDAFVTKINAAGSALVFSTYLGGSDNDVGSDIDVDASGLAHVSGFTSSTNFPTANAIRSAASGQEGFVTKLNAEGTAFAYSTYLGGSGGDAANDIAVDASGNTYVTGGTNSTDFPTTDPAQAAHAGGGDAFVTKLNAAGTAFVYSTYLGGTGFERANAIALDSANNAYVTGLTNSTDFPTLTPVQAANGGDLDGYVFKLGDGPPPTPTPTPTPTPAPTVQFSAANFNVTEGCVPATLTVTLTGTPTGTVAVDYTINEGTAKQKTDYTYAAGTVLPATTTASQPLDESSVGGGPVSTNSFAGSIEFALGETEKEITVLITEDGFAEGIENLTVTLSNPRGANLGTPATATLNINDNDAVNSATNPIDDAPTFVCQLYHDFLHRQPDAAGQSFWSSQITACGADQSCVEGRRHDVAAAFFLSIEFQQTGYFVYRAFETGLDRRPQYEEFISGLNAIGLGVEVGVGDWETRLAAQRLAFATALVQTAEFAALFPNTMTAEQFTDKLFANAGATPTAAERQAVVAAYGTGDTSGRAAALLAALDSGSVFNRLYNPGFVLVEYFGFLRRDPEDPPDTNLDGYNFWLAKIDSFTAPGEDVRDPGTAFERIKRSEMVRAFVISIEYRARFGQ